MQGDKGCEDVHVETSPTDIQLQFSLSGNGTTENVMKWNLTVYSTPARTNRQHGSQLLLKQSFSLAGHKERGFTYEPLNS